VSDAQLGIHQQRVWIRDEVAGIAPFDTVEQYQQTDVLAWIDSGAPLCRTAKPATPARHLVSYFVVMEATHILLVDHKNAGLWLPTGGHVEQGEHPRETVRRELLEELGLASPTEIGAPVFLTSCETVGHTAGHIDVSLWYVVHADQSVPIAFDTSEFHTVRWFAHDQIPYGRTDVHLARFMKKLLTLQRNSAKAYP
jgi:8-oxo-dGTP diphosphatase